MSRQLTNYDKLLRYNVEQGMKLSSKKYLWIADESEGYLKGEIVEDGEKVKVKMGDGAVKTVDKKDTQPANPGKFDGAKDMSDLSHLNDATVLHNLRVRYDEDLIHTYSGLFLVVINPYKWIKIYTEDIIQLYQGRRRNEVHPHVFALADEAYRAMIRNKRNQSMLITGESGAGKTENTKKVIQYLATIAGKATAGGKLEQQILQANPMLEAFGNAKTNKNDNSSRFGKFIRVQFNAGGMICGTTIQVYLLEKSRVVHQGKNERNFHIFYQLCEGADQGIRDTLTLKGAKEYSYLEDKGAIKVKGMDDAKEFGHTMHAMNVIGLTDEERMEVFRVVAGILIVGNIKYKSSYGSEGANIENEEVLNNLTELWGLDAQKFGKSLTRPRVKAGREIVEKHLNIEQAQYSRDAMCKAIYERMFLWLIKKLNNVLAADREANFIGVLDIAGFEIFEFNSFEQLCINFTNEKLQQFFNHHMFKLEQEEYAREKIKWKFIDFGIDSQDTINLIEKKPNSIMSFLDEESIFPKATNETLIQKFHTLSGKSTKYTKVKFKKLAFKVLHYAGDVEYDVSGWIDKNKDPLQQSIEDGLKASDNWFVANLFSDEDLNPRTAIQARKAARAASPSKSKGGNSKRPSRGGSRSASRSGGASFMTVAATYKEQLGDLMATLEATEPHFIRCIIPNLQKKPGYLQADLVLEQLRCNGVLEGIRISRKGFPNRIKYPEFVQRYYLLHNNMKRNEPQSKDASKKLMEYLKDIPTDKYQFGMTKIFFRHGVLAKLEEMREAKLSEMVVTIQCAARGWLGRSAYKKIGAQSNAARVLQKNLKAWLKFKTWGWWKLFMAAKPNLNKVDYSALQKEKEEKISALEEQLAALEKERDALKKKLIAAQDELDDAEDELEDIRSQMKKAKAASKGLEDDNEELNAQIEQLQAKITKLGSETNDLEGDLKEVEDKLKDAEDEFKTESKKQKMLEEDKATQEDDISKNEGTISNLEKDIAKLKKQIANLEEDVENTQGDADNTGDKAASLEKAVLQLQNALDDLNEEVDAARKAKSSAEKQHKDLDAELKDLQAELDEAKLDVQKAKGQQANLESELAETEGDVEEAKKQLSGLQSSKKQLDAKLSDLNNDLADAKDEKSSVQKKGKGLKDAKAQLEQDVEDAESAKSKADGEQKALGNDQAETERQIAAAEGQITKLKSAISALENDLASANAELDADNLAKTKLEKEKKKLENDLRDAQEDLDAAVATKASLSKATSRLEKDSKEASATLVDAEGKQTQLQAENARLQSELADTEVDRDDANRKKGEIERESKAITAELDEAKELLENEQDERLRAEKAQKSANAALTEARADIEDLEGANSDLEEQLRRKSAEANDLAGSLQSQGLTDAKSKWSEATKKLVMELNNARAKLADAEAANRQADRDLKKLEEDLLTEKEKQGKLAQVKDKSDMERKLAEDKLKDSRNELDESRAKTIQLQRELQAARQELTSLRDILSMALQVGGGRGKI